MPTYADLALSKAAAPRAIGGATLAVKTGDGHLFGSPTAERPMRVVVYRGGVFRTILKVTGVDVDVLTIDGTFDDYDDAAVQVGDQIENVPTAGDFNDIYGAIDAISLTPGPQGIQGVPGEPGEQGPDGATGPAGAKGDVGSQGPQGVPGADGATGPAGAKGDPGDTGPTGPKGDTGDQGPAGNDGATGPKGDTGDPGGVGATGPKGDTGATGPAFSTSTVGILKGTGTNITAAVSGTDYVSPSGLTTALSTKADDSTVAHLSGTEDVTGVKTLTTPKAKGNSTTDILQLLNSSGTTVSNFDQYGYGFVEKATFLLALGVDLVTGTNVTTAGVVASANGKITRCICQANTNGASGGFSFTIKKNGTAIFSSAQSVAASTTTVQAYTTFSTTSVSQNDVFTIDVTATGTGVQYVNVTLFYQVRNT